MIETIARNIVALRDKNIRDLVIYLSILNKLLSIEEIELIKNRVRVL